MTSSAWHSPFVFFFDPVLRAPTIGTILMCIGAALTGTLLLLRRQALFGEVLSHAAYPGIIVGLIAVAELFGETDPLLPLGAACGAFATAAAALWGVHRLEGLGVRSDSALCFALSATFGLGVLLASAVQFQYGALYQQVESYLYGQAATMLDLHIAIYALLTLLVIGIISLFFKELEAITFDRLFAATSGMWVRAVDALFLCLVTLTVVVGVRSVGVVLMSAMLIAPPVAARPCARSLKGMLLFASLFGALAAFGGNYLSVQLALYLEGSFDGRVTLPTGPVIVIVATALTAASLLLAPERGLLSRWMRIAAFRHRCFLENLLKALWKAGLDEEQSYAAIASRHTASSLYLRVALWQLVREGWIERVAPDRCRLTADGAVRGAKIVRLHRLWELYLTECVGIGAERVHRSAEEIEHILTPQLERRLTELLHNPRRDPHQREIPPPNPL